MAKGRGGRPTSYDPAYTPQVIKLCMLGATDPQLATFFAVSTSTIKAWAKNFPEFAAARKKGKEDADANVARSLYRRALGYTRPAIKIFCNAKGDVTQVPYTEYVEGDTTAAIFWLKNRRPDQWRDRAPEAPPLDAADVARAVRAAVRAIVKADGLSAA